MFVHVCIMLCLSTRERCVRSCSCTRRVYVQISIVPHFNAARLPLLLAAAAAAVVVLPPPPHGKVSNHYHYFVPNVPRSDGGGWCTCKYTLRLRYGTSSHISTTQTRRDVIVNMNARRR